MSFALWAAETAPPPWTTLTPFDEKGQLQKVFPHGQVRPPAVVDVLRPVIGDPGEAREVDHEQGAARNDVVPVARAAGLDAGLGEDAFDAAAEPLPRPSQPGIDRRRVAGQIPEHDEAGLHVFRMGRERAAFEIDALAAARAALARLHDLARPDDGRDGVPAADDLAERRQVGPDAVECLDPARPEAEARDDLVEDEEDAALGRQAAGQLEVLLRGRDEAADAEEGLDDEAGDAVAVLADDPFEVRAVVEPGDKGPPDDIVEEPGRLPAFEPLGRRGT